MKDKINSKFKHLAEISKSGTSLQALTDSVKLRILQDLTSKRDIIKALVSHFNLELHQMDAKMTFLNVDPKEKVYMHHTAGFCDKDESHPIY